jgi:23S rRNA pseudouridine1911/1915/1917 synthase
MDIQIIFEDNHMLVINKPSGILTQPSGTDQISAESLAKQWLKQKYNKPGNVFLEALHRIDKPVSGIVLFAKTSKALSRLQHAMRSKQSYKHYFAIVEGTLTTPEATLENYLFHDDYFARVVPPHTPNAKLARLHYKVINQQPECALLEIILDTGRYHQIRVQFSHIGHPIIGDVRYGSKKHYQPNAITLHHHKLQIPHPITEALMTFESPHPTDWIIE